MGGEWSFLEAQVEVADLVAVEGTTWSAMNVENQVTLLESVACVSEQVAWVLEAVAGALVPALDIVVAQAMVPGGMLPYCLFYSNLAAA